jgi:hypothetical protein
VAPLHEEPWRHDRGANNRPRQAETQGHAKAAGEGECRAQAAPPYVAAEL